jgi:hypothetical protein
MVWERGQSNGRRKTKPEGGGQVAVFIVFLPEERRRWRWDAVSCQRVMTDETKSRDHHQEKEVNS